LETFAEVNGSISQARLSRLFAAKQSQSSSIITLINLHQSQSSITIISHQSQSPINHHQSSVIAIIIILKI
jgi:hypothetical protein